MEKLPEHVGLDFGHHSVKAVLMGNIDAKKPKVLNLGSQVTPQGVIDSEDESHQNALAEAVKLLYSSLKLHNRKVVMAMPEYSVFTRFSEIIGVKQNELENAVFYEAKKYIPIPIEEVRVSFLQIGFDKERDAFKVLIVAAPRKIVDIYLSVAQKVNLEPLAIETESVAMGRAMFRATGLKHLLMLDFGAQSTDMSLMHDGNLVYSQSISIGSDALTQAIINKFDFEYAQAEEYKRNYGIQKDVLEGKVYETVKPVVDSIITEVRRGLEFYKTKTLLSVPEKCLLNGDGALLPGLSEYMTNSLGINCEIADPFATASIPRKFSNMLGERKASYSVAIGLSLKERY